MKKTWIKIKRGLLKPEHRERLGIRIWLYMYMLDKVDWETGKIYGWKDKDEAEDFGMPWRTLQKQRQEIEEADYITCVKRKYTQEIIIHKWTNPREYTGEEYNQEDESTQTRVHSEDNGNESTHESTHQPDSKVGTPSYSSQITNHIDKEEVLKLGGGGFYIFNLVGADFNEVNDRMRISISNLFKKHGEYRVCQLAADFVADVPDTTLSSLLGWITKKADLLPITPMSEVEGDYY